MITKNILVYCKDYWNIENYEQAVSDSEKWAVHHRLEVSEDGQHTLHTVKELKEMGLYFNRPSDELIFLPLSEHNRLHKGTIENRISNSRSKSSVIHKKHPLPIICLTNGHMYDSIAIAARELCIHYTNILKVCNGDRKRTDGRSFMYFDEYIKNSTPDSCTNITSSSVILF